jgi:lia operon protein LiaG
MPFAESSRMRFRSAIVHAAPLALFVLVIAAPSLGAQGERRVLSGDRVAIYNLAGRLRVESGSGSDVVVEITRGGRDSDRLRVEEGNIDGDDALRVIYPSDRIVYPELERGSRMQIDVRDDGTWGESRSSDGRRSRGSFGRERNRVEISNSGSGLEAYADMVVRVPRGQRLVIHNAVGDARITMVDADLAVEVAGSTITSERTRGHLSLDTGSGSISVTDAQGDVNLDTGSGSVTISGVRGESLRMDTGSGSISGGDIEVSELKADVGSGGVRLARVRATRVDVDAGSGGTELELLSTIEHLKVEAGSGGVTVRLPESTNADVDIETGSGGIDTDFAVQVTRFEQRHMIGRIGNGRGQIHIESGSGHVRLLKG